MEALFAMLFLLFNIAFFSKNNAIAIIIRVMTMVTYGRLLEIVRLFFFMGDGCVANGLLVERVRS